MLTDRLVLTDIFHNLIEKQMQNVDLVTLYPNHYADCCRSDAVITYTNSETAIPKMFASRPKGSASFKPTSSVVVSPPANMASNAACELGFFVNNAASTGTSNPDTIKA